MSDVWVVCRRAEGAESFDAEVFQGLYETRELAKEHYELIDGSDAHEWEDDEAISIAHETGLAIILCKVHDQHCIDLDREWRERLFRG